MNQPVSGMTAHGAVSCRLCMTDGVGFGSVFFASVIYGNGLMGLGFLKAHGPFTSEVHLSAKSGPSPALNFSPASCRHCSPAVASASVAFLPPFPPFRERMWSAVRRVSSLLMFRVKRATSFPVSDEFKIASCQKLVDEMHACLVFSAENFGTRYPKAVPNVQVESECKGKRGVQVFTTYSDASVLDFHIHQKERDASISSLLCENGIPQFALIASFRGDVTNAVAERFGLVKSNWLLDFFGVKNAHVYTDAVSVGNPVIRLMHRMEMGWKLSSKAEEEVKDLAARMLVTGRSIKIVNRTENVLADFFAEFAQTLMPRQAIKKPKSLVRASDVTNFRVLDFSTLDHNLHL